MPEEWGLQPGHDFFSNNRGRCSMLLHGGLELHDCDAPELHLQCSNKHVPDPIGADLRPKQPTVEVDVPYAEVPHAEVPHAEVPHAEVPHAEVPHAEVRHGEAQVRSMVEESEVDYDPDDASVTGSEAEAQDSRQDSADINIPASGQDAAAAASDIPASGQDAVASAAAIATPASSQDAVASIPASSRDGPAASSRDGPASSSSPAPIAPQDLVAHVLRVRSEQVNVMWRYLQRHSGRGSSSTPPPPNLRLEPSFISDGHEELRKILLPESSKLDAKKKRMAWSAGLGAAATYCVATLR